jgi:hypothetical protein
MFEVLTISDDPLIEAAQFTNNSKNSVFHWIRCNCYADYDALSQPIIRIDSPKGVLTAHLGDYIIRENNMYYPLNPEKFNEFYNSKKRLYLGRISGC